MSQKKTWTIIRVLVFLVALCIIGIELAVVIKGNRQPPPPEVDLEELLRPEREKIDSLQIEISRREEYIERLRDSVRVVEIIRPSQVEEIRKLPNDEATEFLKNKLREYEEEY